MDYELAGLGSRALATFVDTGLLLLLMVAATLVFSGLAKWLGSLSVVLMIVLPFAFVWGYFALFEGLSQGQTPGKRLLGLRVIGTPGTRSRCARR